MAEQVKKGYLRGVRGVLLTVLEADGALPAVAEKYWIDTAQEASVEGQVEDGESSTHRGGDRILVQVQEDDTLTGVEVSFVDARFDAKSTSIISGGSIITSGVDGEITGWQAPMMDDQEKVPFMAEIYVQNFNAGGMKDGFVKVTVPYCKGNIPNVTYSDQEWATEEFSIIGKENSALQVPMPVTSKEFVPSLPSEALTI